MSAEKAEKPDYKTLSRKPKTGGAGGQSTLEPPESFRKKIGVATTLENPSKKNAPKERARNLPEIIQPEKTIPKTDIAEQIPLDYVGQKKREKQQKSIEKDRRLIEGDRWILRNGHALTYAGIFLFTLVVYFRPYELTPALSGFTSLALIIAIATLLIYLPTQLSTEGNLTTFSTEIKCILLMAGWAVLTIPIAKDPSLAWATFNDTFSKVVLIFIVMVNTLRTKERLKGLMWLSIGVGVMLSYQAIGLYRQGVFKTEGYRVNVDFGGMFGNPNDMALHLVIFTPIAVTLGLASKNKLAKIAYFAAAALMVAGNMVTQSRGGFLGLLAIAAVLVWKLGRNRRFKVILAAAVIGLVVITLAPGNYGLRILSIFVPSLDPVGSSNQRSELLQQSIWVTLRNPQGIGLGNFPVVGIDNLQTHNAYTQVSSELGWAAAIAYVILMVSPLRKLTAIERRLFDDKDYSWLYYLSIGVEASIIGYMVSSFFGPVAYNWYVYYPIAYAVCLRRIYQTNQAAKGVAVESENGLSDYFKPQKA